MTIKNKNKSKSPNLYSLFAIFPTKTKQEAVPAAASATAAGGDETCASWEERTGMHTWPRKNRPLTVAAAAAAGVAGAGSESARVTAGGGL